GRAALVRDETRDRRGAGLGFCDPAETGEDEEGHERARSAKAGCLHGWSSTVGRLHPRQDSDPSPPGSGCSAGVRRILDLTRRESSLQIPAQDITGYVYEARTIPAIRALGTDSWDPFRVVSGIIVARTSSSSPASVPRVGGASGGVTLE